MARTFLGVVGFGLAALVGAQTVSEPIVLNSNSAPQCITPGPDGRLWFAERGGSKIGRLALNSDGSPSGPPTEFPASGLSGMLTLRMQCLTPGPDGNMWFSLAEAGNGQIGKITSDGTVTLVTGVLTSRVYGITAGPDGNLWFVEAGNNVAKIGRITPGGDLTEFTGTAPGNFFSVTNGIIAGPDGAMWFTEEGGDRIGRIATSGGTPDEFVLPANSGPAGIVNGPDGALWFAENKSNKIGRMTRDGTLTNEYTIPTANSGPQGITVGPDGNLWFTESANSGNQIGRITRTGQITEFPIPSASSQASGITSAGGRIWFTELSGSRIGTIGDLGPPRCAPGATTLCLNNNRFKVEVSWSAPDQGQSGVGTAARLTDDTGYFWFFNSANIELVIKVLDARALSGHFWVFYGALSDVAYTITVTDTQTGTVKQYQNQYHHLASVSDTSTFTAETIGPEAQNSEPALLSAAEIGNLSAAELYALYGALTQTKGSPATAAPCAAGSQTLCLNGGRFQVTVEWSAPSQGTSGHGMAHPVTDDTGYMWFFSDTNVELVIKVLDGRAITGHFWVFYGALSNVHYIITVRDTQTGAVKTYENPDGHQASSADTSAF